MQKKSQGEVDRKQSLLGNAKSRVRPPLPPGSSQAGGKTDNVNKHTHSSMVVLTCLIKCYGITRGGSH